jgi:lysophospholipase L1-like esterase
MLQSRFVRPVVLSLGAVCAAAFPVPSAGAPRHLAPHASAAYNYTAIGASDAVGVGSTHPCTSPSCPGGTGYVPDIARLLAQTGATVTLDDLGISGAYIGPDFAMLREKESSCAGSPGQVYDFITNELPQVPSATNVMTIFAGGNDTNVVVEALICGFGGSTKSSEEAYVDARTRAFGADYDSLIAGVRQRAPGLRLAILNLPNFAGVPAFVNAPLPVRSALQTTSVGFDDEVINRFAAEGIPVVDLLCDPRAYDPANYSSDGFHPNDKGYAIIAAELAPVLEGKTIHPPRAHCPQRKIVPPLAVPLDPSMPRLRWNE